MVRYLFEPREVYDIYRNNRYDLFISLSSSEGLPVSMMEAQSFGIPILATAVGGVPEIVNKETGFLLPETPNVDEITRVLSEIILKKENLKAKRLSARKHWEMNFNAEKNYPRFIEKISNKGSPENEHLCS